MDDKLKPVFRPPHLQPVPDEAPAGARQRRLCPTRRQRRFARRLAQRRAAATAK